MTDHDMHDDRADRDTDDRFRPDDQPRLGPLSKFDDFTVADGYPDPRGWHVIASDGTDVGKVHDLIVDTGTMHTRFLDVRLDHDHIPAAAGRPTDDWDVLVPIGTAQLVESDEAVRLPSLTPVQLVGLPVFEHGEITSDYENAVLAGVGAAAATATTRAASTRTAEEEARLRDDARRREEARIREEADRRAAAGDTTPNATGTTTTTTSGSGIVQDENEVRIPLATEAGGAPIIREEIVITRHRVLGDRATGSTDVNAPRNP